MPLNSASERSKKSLSKLNCLETMLTTLCTCADKIIDESSVAVGEKNAQLLLKVSLSAAMYMRPYLRTFALFGFLHTYNQYKGIITVYAY